MAPFSKMIEKYKSVVDRFVDPPLLPESCTLDLLLGGDMEVPVETGCMYC